MNLGNPPLHPARAIHGSVDLGLPARQPTSGNAEKSDHEGFRGIIGNLLNSSSSQQDVAKVTLKIQLSCSSQEITNVKFGEVNSAVVSLIQAEVMVNISTICQIPGSRALFIARTNTVVTVIPNKNS